MELFLRTDDQIEEMKGRLELGRHLPVRHIAAFSVTVASDTPQVWAIVDVERGSGFGRSGKPKGLEHSGFSALIGQVRARHDDGACRGNIVRVDVIFAERHVRAVLTIEYQRKVSSSRIPKSTSAVRRSGSVPTPPRRHLRVEAVRG